MHYLRLLWRRQAVNATSNQVLIVKPAWISVCCPKHHLGHPPNEACPLPFTFELEQLGLLSNLRALCWFHPAGALGVGSA